MEGGVVGVGRSWSRRRAIRGRLPPHRLSELRDRLRGARERREAAATTYFEERGFTAPLEDACVRWFVNGDALVQRAERDGTDHLARAVDEDWFWYSTTARGRLMFRAAIVATFTETHPETSALARRLLERMNQVWEPQAIDTRRTHVS